MLLAMSLFLAQAALPEGATCLWSKSNPKGPKSYELPVAGQSGEALLIDWYVDTEPVGITTPAALSAALPCHPSSSLSVSPFPLHISLIPRTTSA